MVGFEILPVIYFLVLTWCFGYTLRRLIKKGEDSFLEANLMNFGIGLGVIPILGALLGLLHLQIVWWLFLLLALIMPIYDLFNYILKSGLIKSNFVKSNGDSNDVVNEINLKGIFNKIFGKIKFGELLKIKKSTIYVLLMLIMFICLFFVMNKGAFLNPWLENGDSWGHVGHIKYMELHKTYYTPGETQLTNYGIPYPPGYDILMTILFQISQSSYWALKFFNALLVSLATIFFYFFAKEFTNDKKIALFATLILTIIPSFLSHFIWSKTLAILLYFPALYCILRSEQNKKWLIPSIIIVASILITAPVTAFYLAPFLGILWLGKLIATKKLNLNIIYAALGGLVLSLLFWGDMFIRYTFKGVLIILNIVKVKGGTDATLTKLLHVHGTGATKYKFMDFIWVNTYNMINNPKGIGLVLSILVLFAVISFIYLFIYPFVSKYIQKYSKKDSKEDFKEDVKERKSYLRHENAWVIVSVIWLLFGLFSVLGEHFPIQMPYAFRAWSYLAIPVALLGAFGYFSLLKIGKKIKIPVFLIFVIIISGLFLTTGYQKYTVNTAMWGNENFGSMEEVQLYQWMQNNLPKNTKVMSYCGDWLDVTGYDKLQEGWIPEIEQFRKNVAGMDANDVHTFLKSNQYEYLIIDTQCLKKPYNSTFANERIQQLMSSGLFNPVQGTQTGQLLRTN
ncbi:phospholipid carrier-dependent glycosyltransferase [Candidatus Woesearchaeota archaeon]|jgi:hypothetical protein|nr:phospholipid carrier-dependent glycosyltransferase [Candidatus Woesearchaeota archaeon]